MSDALLQELLDAGCPPMLVVKVGQEIARLCEQAAALERRREADRERQAKRRAEHNVNHVTSRDVADMQDTPPALDKETSPIPPKEINLTPRARSPRACEAFPKPEWADAQVWADFLANRKRKKLANTPTAHKAFLDDVARLTDDAWPPGRLLEVATARGHGAIYPSIKENQNGNRSQRRMDGQPGLRGSRPDPSLDLYRNARAAEEAERSASGGQDNWRAWAALPAIGSG